MAVVVALHRQCRQEETDGGAAVYSAAPNLPAGLPRGIAPWAGVRVFCDSDDVLYAGRGMVALHASTTGEKRITLPAQARVRDFFGGRDWPQPTDVIECHARRGETFVFTLDGVD
jgi:hypothetical protein